MIWDCGFAFVSGDFSAGGGVQLSATPERSALVADLRASLTTAAVGESAAVPTRPADAWTAPSCEELSIATDMPAVMGDPALFAVNRGHFESDMYEAAIASGRMACSWRSEAGARGPSIEIIPGAAWLMGEAATASGSESVVVGGATAAYLVPLPYAPGYSALVASVGSNVVAVRGDDIATPFAAIAAAAIGYF
jgi:hypothetical protein